MDKKSFGKRLKEARCDQKLTAEALAVLCGVDDTHIRHMEGGNRAPSIEIFVKLCNILSVSPNYLLKDSLGKNELDEIILLSEQIKVLNTKQLAMINDVVATILAHFSNTD